MKPISCNQEMGDIERLLCPGALQGPAQYQNGQEGVINATVTFASRTMDVAGPGFIKPFGVLCEAGNRDLYTGLGTGWHTWEPQA